MKIELYLTGHEIDQLREIMDNAPLNPYAPVIVKVLAALPITAHWTDSALCQQHQHQEDPLVGNPELDALVEFQRNSRQTMDRLDASIDEYSQRRRGNPLYDMEWFV